MLKLLNNPKSDNVKKFRASLSLKNGENIDKVVKVDQTTEERLYQEMTSSTLNQYKEDFNAFAAFEVLAPFDIGACVHDDPLFSNTPSNSFMRVFPFLLVKKLVDDILLSI